MKNIAVITGASSGLGKEFTRILVRRKEIEEIWALARNEKKLEQLKRELGKKVKIISMDLSDIDNVKSIDRLFKEEDVTIRYLVNSAGFAKFCSYDDLSIDESVSMINLNISSVVAMGLVCIPYMDDKCHIVNFASQAAFQPVPYQNLYSSTKAFIRNYTRALNIELKETGIRATAVCPGFLKTELLDKADIGARRATNNFVGLTTPDKVAVKAIHDADAGKDMSVYGGYIKLSHFMSKILPQKVIMKMWLKQQNIS